MWHQSWPDAVECWTVGDEGLGRHTSQPAMELILSIICLNPYLTNGFSHHYHLVESTSVLRGIRCDF